MIQFTRNYVIYLLSKCQITSRYGKVTKNSSLTVLTTKFSFVLQVESYSNILNSIRFVKNLLYTKDTKPSDNALNINSCTSFNSPDPSSLLYFHLPTTRAILSAHNLCSDDHNHVNIHLSQRSKIDYLKFSHSRHHPEEQQQRSLQFRRVEISFAEFLGYVIIFSSARGRGGGFFARRQLIRF